MSGTTVTSLVSLRLKGSKQENEKLRLRVKRKTERSRPKSVRSAEWSGERTSEKARGAEQRGDGGAAEIRARETRDRAEYDAHEHELCIIVCVSA